MSVNIKTETNRAVATHEKRARGIAAMGLVTRDGEKFRVSSPVMDGREDRFEVWRDPNGNVRCTCLDVTRSASSDGALRCEHILAVKHALLLNNGDAVTPETATPQTPAAVSTNAKDDFTQLSEAGNQSACLTENNSEPVEWRTVAGVLDRIAPKWSFAIRSVQQIGERFVVVASITIDGMTRDGIGTANCAGMMGIQQAEQDAMNHAASRFAFYRANKFAVVEPFFPQKDPTKTTLDPVAKSLGELVMPKQLGMIRALARGAGIEADDESIKLYECKSDSLSRRAAAEFIEHLKGLQQERAVRLRRAS